MTVALENKKTDTEHAMNMTQGLKRSLQQTPHKAAVRYQGREWTFSELGDRVARLAGALQGLGMREGDLVASATGRIASKGAASPPHITVSTPLTAPA